MSYRRWPRELNALQLQKTHANRKSTSKSRKHIHHFDSRWWKCSQHKQIKKHTANAHNTTKYILFGAQPLLVVLWAFAACVMSTWGSCFLTCRCFFYLQSVELSRPPYLYLSEPWMAQLCICGVRRLSDFINYLNLCSEGWLNNDRIVIFE